MKKLIVASAILLGNVTFSPTHPSQPTPQCDFERIDNPVMFLCIDWVDESSGIIAGWAYDKRKGDAPIAIQMFTPQGMVNPEVIRVARPDVAAYFNTPNQNLGFGLILNHKLQPGLYAVLTSDIPYSWDCSYDANNGVYCGWISPEVVFRVQ